MHLVVTRYVHINVKHYLEFVHCIVKMNFGAHVHRVFAMYKNLKTLYVPNYARLNT